jgi:hypothetical protein
MKRAQRAAAKAAQTAQMRQAWMDGVQAARAKLAAPAYLTAEEAKLIEPYK